MSYILDALKKADAERERGAVPGLHSQPQVQPDDGPDTPRRMSPAVWGMAALGLCVIAVLSWMLLSRDGGTRAPAPGAASDSGPGAGEFGMPPRPEAHAQQPGTQPPPGAPPMPVQTAGNMPPTGMPPEGRQPPAFGNTAGQAPAMSTPPPAIANTGTTAQPPAPMPAPVNAQARNPAAPPTTLPTAPNAATRATDKTPVASAQTSPAATGATPVTPPSATPTPARVPSVNELPDDIRRDLPQLVIGGAMYSDTPSSRMLIVNSQVFHEGDQPYQGLVLEEIRLKSAIFKYRGYRYAVQY